MSRTLAKITQADVARAAQNGDTFIYFARAGEFVKIGQSRNWKVRICNMQVGSPYTVVPLLVLIAPPSLEGTLHGRFHGSHFRGEWFRLGSAIQAYIKENLKHCVADSIIRELPKPPAKAEKHNPNVAAGWDDVVL